MVKFPSLFLVILYISYSKTFLSKDDPTLKLSNLITYVSNKLVSSFDVIFYLLIFNYFKSFNIIFRFSSNDYIYLKYLFEL